MVIARYIVYKQYGITSLCDKIILVVLVTMITVCLIHR